jgi:single-strand DNA-binding protein
MDLNKVNLLGNLTQDPELKSLASGQSVTAFNLATNYVWYDARSKEKKSRADFHKVVAWGHLADIITTYLKKGSKIYVEGRLQNRTWDDKEGKKHYATEIIASDLIMLGGSKKESLGDETAKEDIEVEEIQIENN